MKRIRKTSKNQIANIVERITQINMKNFDNGFGGTTITETDKMAWLMNRLNFHGDRLFIESPTKAHIQCHSNLWFNITLK